MCISVDSVVTLVRSAKQFLNKVVNQKQAQGQRQKHRGGIPSEIKINKET